ncbi:MAG TPA: right-handed parallel beta-helix repeat-containing protein [bacterium]|nr:right-handed parallel beta-helix repeat-containing protein [bacterium]
MMKTGSVSALGAALALAVSTASHAGVHRVPADFGSIAAALSAASAGDTVKVAAGTYFEHVTLKDGVELRGGYDGSYADPSNPSFNVTQISGSGIGAAITASGMSSATIVDGFKLSGGGGSPGAGVIVTGGAPVFTNNDISGNRQAGIAGGVYIAGGSAARFESNDVRNNSSQGSGGGFHVENSTPLLLSNLIEANVAPGSGGGVYLFKSAAVCSLNVFRDNRAGNGGGGAVRVQYTTGARIVGSEIRNCVAAFGGGIFVKDASTVTVTDCDFIDCRADWSGASSDTTTHHGGGIAVAPFCSMIATDCGFERCEAVGSTARGGAIYGRQSTVSLTGAGDPTSMPDAYILDCSSDYQGGGVWLDACSGTFARIAMDNCSAAGRGGAMYVAMSVSSALDIDQNLITGCSADDGGAILLTSTVSPGRATNIRNNTIFGCSASSATKAGGIGHYGPATTPPSKLAVIAGNIIANTMVGSCASCATRSKPIINCTTIFQDPSNSAAALFNADCISAFGGDSSNSTGDPRFCGPGLYTLQSCSPAAGTAGAGCPNALPSLPDRGASTGSACACLLVSIEEESWGRIKARYR